jgi:uncharacterized membrane protein YkoI
MQYRAVMFTIIAVTGVGMLLNQGISAAGEMHDNENDSDRLEHSQARELREQGKILPLQEILRKVSEKYPGQVIETELEHKSGRYIYELEVVDDDGKVMEIEMDAGSGEFIKAKAED